LKGWIAGKYMGIRERKQECGVAGNEGIPYPPVEFHMIAI